MAKIGDKRFDVEAGDLVLIPANEWHGTENPSDEAMVVYAVAQREGLYLQKPVITASAMAT